MAVFETGEDVVVAREDRIERGVGLLRGALDVDEEDEEEEGNLVDLSNISPWTSEVEEEPVEVISISDTSISSTNLKNAVKQPNFDLGRKKEVTIKKVR